MDPTAFAVSRSSDIALDSLQFNEEIERLISPQPPENATSFTALLELIPPTHAIASQSTLRLGSGNPYYFNYSIADEAPPPLPSNSDSLGLSSNFSALSGKKVKDEESATKSNSSPQPVVSDPATESKGRRSEKRKERDHQKKGQGSAKRSKSERLQEAQILPYVYVRARRGHATDSHSLAERARREKINARMKLLQELVPGCSKISGTALVLDEIINHVQSLQHQVYLLSMKIADSIYAPEVTCFPYTPYCLLDRKWIGLIFGTGFLFSLSQYLMMGSVIDDSSFPCMITPPPIWPDEQVVSRIPEQFEQQWHFNNTLHHQVWGKDTQNLTNPEVSLLSYDSSANALTLRSDPMKMELRRPPN